jgi:DNA-binding protein Fis
MTINLYVNNSYTPYVDQLRVISEANKKPLSTEICKAVKQYIQNLNDEKDLVAEDSEWNEFIQNATKEQLYEMSRVICGLNDRIIRKVCQ